MGPARSLPELFPLRAQPRVERDIVHSIPTDMTDKFCDRCHVFIAGTYRDHHDLATPSRNGQKRNACCFRRWQQRGRG
jgi:hypothetical protein